MSSSSSKYQNPYVLTPYEDPTSFGDVDFTTRLKYDIVKHAVNGPEFLRCVDSEISSKGLSSTYNDLYPYGQSDFAWTSITMQNDQHPIFARPLSRSRRSTIPQSATTATRGLRSMAHTFKKCRQTIWSTIANLRDHQILQQLRISEAL